MSSQELSTVFWKVHIDMFIKFIIKFIMIKLAMDSLHLDFVKCSSIGSHKGLCFLAGDLKEVSSVCVLQQGHLLFSHKLCSLFPLSSQFQITMFKISVHYDYIF